jgi:hypothetical protein
MPWGKHKGEDVVAICAGGPRQERALRPLAGTWEELPCDTFAGTSVRSVLLSVERDKLTARTPGAMASDAGEAAE